jgi:hypothetical protein
LTVRRNVFSIEPVKLKEKGYKNTNKIREKVVEDKCNKIALASLSAATDKKRWIGLTRILKQRYVE